MGAERVRLKEMVMTMSRLANTVNRKTNKQTMNSIFCRCGFCVRPKRTNSVTLLGGLWSSIQEITPSQDLHSLQKHKGRLLILRALLFDVHITAIGLSVTVEHILCILTQ